MDDVNKNLIQPDKVQALYMFDYCASMRSAFYKSFTRTTIISSCKRAELCPFEPSRVLETRHSHNDNYFGMILSPQKMFELLERKRKEARIDVLGENVTLLCVVLIETF